MKKYLLTGLAFAYCFIGLAQSDTISTTIKDLNLELLESPTNPAFLLMGSTPTEIVKPGSTPEFYASIQNASSNFTVLPNNFAFIATPYWWGKGAKDLSFNDDFKSENEFSFYRTLSFSGGMLKGISDDPNLWRYAIGFQSTLLRGKVNANKKKAYLDKLLEYNKKVYGDINSYYNKNEDYNRLETRRIEHNLKIKEIDELNQNGQLGDAEAEEMKQGEIKKLIAVQAQIDSIKNVLGEQFEKETSLIESNKDIDKYFNQMNEREGLKWDVGGGVAINSQDNNLDSTGLYRIGLWSNIGGKFVGTDSSASKLEGYFLTRYLYYDEVISFSDSVYTVLNSINTLDLGLKLAWNVQHKFILSIEGIYRLSLNDDRAEGSFKLNGMLQYLLGKNRLVYMSLGNNFKYETLSDELYFTIGFNIGFGGNVDLYGVKL